MQHWRCAHAGFRVGDQIWLFQRGLCRMPLGRPHRGRDAGCSPDDWHRWGYGPPVPPRGVYLAGPPPHAAMPPVSMPHAAYGPRFLPPGAAIALLRRQGFREAGPLALRGETLVVAATDAGLGGGPVTVVMDAYDGEVLSVVPRRTFTEPFITVPCQRRVPSDTACKAPRAAARPAKAHCGCGARAVESCPVRCCVAARAGLSASRGGRAQKLTRPAE